MQETANAQSLSQSENSALARSKAKLEEAKEQFLKELNHRDPTWAAKVRQKKEADIAKMMDAKNELVKQT